MYRFKPFGKTHIEVCTNLSCALAGADQLIESTCRKLGVARGRDDRGREVHRQPRRVPGRLRRRPRGAGERRVAGERDRAATSTACSRARRVYKPFDWPKSRGRDRHPAQRLEGGLAPRSRSTRQGGGYAKLKDHLTLKPEEIVEKVKKSGLRGRGGAGFPTGLKWSFLPKDNPKPRYLCVNADESEPGTYKDRLIIENDPHQLIEAYRRLDLRDPARRPATSTSAASSTRASARSRRRSPRRTRRATSGKNILGTGVDVDVFVHGGAGAYECGEETALLESPRGQARPAAAQAAVPGDERALRLPDHRQQRRDDRGGAADPRARAGVVRRRTGPRRTAGPSSTASAAT